MSDKLPISVPRVRVLRFSRYDALTNTEGVLLEILRAAGFSLDDE